MSQILWLSASRRVPMVVKRVQGIKKDFFWLKREIIGLGIKSLGGSWKWKLNPLKLGQRRVDFSKKIHPEWNDQWSVETSKMWCVSGSLVSTLISCFGTVSEVMWKSGSSNWVEGIQCPTLKPRKCKLKNGVSFCPSCLFNTFQF